jgi:hypothetical protein
MGARTDFVKAMVLGVIVGVAITTTFFQLRETSCPPVEQPVYIQPIPELPSDAAR